MMGNQEYAFYTPNNTNIEKLSREFLLTLVAYVDPQLYKTFYLIYKEQAMQRQYNKWNNYTVDIKSDVLTKLKQFMSVDANNTNSRGFSLSKNHFPNYTFQKSDVENEQKKIIQKNASTISIKIKKVPNNIEVHEGNNKIGGEYEIKDIEMKNNAKK